MEDPAKPIIIWFRQDLRLQDHPALAEAAASGRPIVALYVLDEDAAGAWRPGGASRWWLHHSLAALGSDLTKLGVTLVLRRGDTAEQIEMAARDAGADSVFAGAAVEPWARRAEREAAAALGRLGAPLRLFRAVSLFSPDEIRTKAGGGFDVYTPFAKACFARGGPGAPHPKPRALTPGPAIPSDALAEWNLTPVRPDWAVGLRETWTPGEASAHARLKQFLRHALQVYDARRNLPGLDGTSMLSPHLHFGEISPAGVWRAAIQAAEGAGKGLDVYLRELLWREFSLHLLWRHPDLPDAPLRPGFAAMPSRRDPEGFHAWTRGRTGAPIVDAGMRQLWRIGWMHNRVRMIAASFLVKHLLLPWQDGEAWFWDTLVDADLAANSASWQWVAGSGADAAPYFRVFNPALQGGKFDPDGAYVRRWVPELAGLDNAHIHAPWEASGSALAAAGVRLGETYPHPIVGLAEGRARALEAYRSLSEPTG